MTKFRVIDGGLGGGSGPEDPMLERVFALEAADYATLKADVARIDGKLSNIPTMWQLLTMIVSTWAAGAAIVFTIFRFAGK